MKVESGLERLAGARAELIRGCRVGLICHPASVDRDLVHAAQRLGAVSGTRVVRLFAPEHGVAGGQQDMQAVDEMRDPLTGLPVVSLYGSSESSLAPPPDSLDGLDVLVADLQDVGSRYYTFANTIVRTLPVAGAAGVRVVIADRPNPIGGVHVEGNLVSRGFESFVGELPIANRHALTVAELCLLAREERGIAVELDVVAASGWRRDLSFEQTGLPWVLPSPNMPSVETAVVYPGSCLVEGTNLSEGRGTTRPFELIGAPWLDGAALARELANLGLPGVTFRPTSFVPSFQKHAGAACGGVQLHVNDRQAFRPVLTGLAVVVAARSQDPERFQWRTEPYEFVADIPAFDLLAGTDGWRLEIERGADARDIAAEWSQHQAKMEEWISRHGLYPVPTS